MKPNPRSVNRALAILDEPPEECALIGDSVSDIQVARAAGVRSIGFAKHQRRGQELIAAHTDVLTETITELASTMGVSPGRQVAHQDTMVTGP